MIFLYFFRVCTNFYGFVGNGSSRVAGRLGLLLSLLSIRGEIGTRQALLTFFLFPYSIFISFYYFIYYLFLVPISFIFSTLPKRLEVDIFRT